MITESSKNMAVRHAKAEFPREACGLFTVDTNGVLYHACENISKDRDTFIMAPEDYLKATKFGKVVGLFHSHCNCPPTPSDADRAVCEATQVPSYIFSLPNELWETVYPAGFEAPYLGRRWVYGVFDCYSLMKDWLKREKKIELPEFERRPEWWNKGENLFLDNLELNGFKKIPLKELQRGDIILMQISSKVPNHVAVYLGNDKILQHLINRISSEYVYGGYWHKVTSACYRHEGSI